MLRIVNCSLNMFKQRIKGKKLFMWGGGNRAEICYKEWKIQENVMAVIDFDEKMWNKGWHVDEKISCISKREFLACVNRYGVKNCALLITPTFYAMDIIEELDSIADLNELESYVASLISEYYAVQEFEFTKDSYKIPKKIHYFWFGGKEMPDKFKENIRTWRHFCPDYDIIRWDESNYDIKKNQYMYEAYQAGRFGFVPDFARLDIIFNYGGIYLDTDVEVCKGLDDLLCDNSFFSIDFELCVNCGSGFGAAPGNRIIEDMMRVYEDKHFINKDGGLNLKPCYHYQNPVLIQYGFELTQKYQNIEGNVLYPCEVFAPVAIYSGAKRMTEKTHSIHYGELSWITENERKAKERFKNKIGERINVHL